MSADDFELLESNESNHDEKDLQSEDIDLNEIIRPNLISSHALLTNSEPVSLAGSSQSSQIINEFPSNEQKSEIINNINNNNSDSDDMNLEQTPPIINKNNQFSEKHNHEIKQKEEDDNNIPIEGNINNGSPKEGINNNNNNNIPIISNVNNVTPNHIMQNPYFNGSKCTPCGDSDNEGGEQSDDIDMTDSDDEEKDDKNHIIPSNKNISYINISMILFSIIFACISYLYYHQYFDNTCSSQPEPPKFDCPSSIIYVPMDGNSFYINASHANHPLTTKYEWDIINMMEHDDLFIDGEDTSSLLLIKSNKPGSILIELYISCSIDNIYMFNKQCSITVIFYKKPYFGIDLGTTYSCIAYQTTNKYQERQTKQRLTKIIVADKTRREYCIPTAIYFPQNSNKKVIIGEDALKKLAIDPKNVIYDIKRIVGRHCNDPEINSFKEKHSFNITCNSDSSNSETPKIFIPNLNEFIVPEQALAVILAHLVEIASIEFGVPYICDIVVSIPALFHNGQRKAIHSSCELVGLNVQRLVVEPTAAALAYSYYSSTPKDNFKLFLTFDFGGGTIDCSVLRCTGVDCQVIGVRGNSSLGGIDFDLIIRDIMIKKYSLQHSWNNIIHSDKLYAKFLKVAEKIKKSLTFNTQHQVTMTNDELLKDDFSTFYSEKKQIIITRKEFEQDPRTQQLINSAIETARLAINNDRIKSSNIRMILMIGGTSKIPIIQQRLKEEFGSGNGDLKLVFPSDDPQLMVVKGSAIIGASLAFDHFDGGDNTLKNIVLEDVIPLSLGFSICLTNYNESGKIKCGIMDIIIPKNSHYPTRSNTVYCQKDPISNVAKLDLYEGDNEFVEHNYFLSHLSINGIPKRNENICESIIVEFIIDKNGIANIEAIVNDKNKTKFVDHLSVISSDGSLSNNDIKMLKRKMIKWFDGHESIQKALRD